MPSLRLLVATAAGHDAPSSDCWYRRDVSRAADLAPGDNVIRAFLAKLRAEKARQKEADRVTFAGMFDRGKVCDPE